MIQQTASDKPRAPYQNPHSLYHPYLLPYPRFFETQAACCHRAENIF
jgi:hypothetical protein